MAHERKLICLDFDGCISNSVHGGYDQDAFIFEPTEGIKEWIEEMSQYHDFVIFSARELTDVGKSNLYVWLEKHGFPKLKITNVKPARGHLFIDDRAYNFDGSNLPTVDFVTNFKPWNRK